MKEQYCYYCILHLPTCQLEYILCIASDKNLLFGMEFVSEA